MTNFSIKDFLTENKKTEVSQLRDLSERLDEVKGSETKEGQEIISYIKSKLGLGKDGEKLLKKNLDNAFPPSIRNVHKTVQRWKKDNYKMTPQDVATINNTLERK